MGASKKVIVEKIARSFSNIFSSIKERKMQRAVLAERLKELDCDTITELLHHFVMKSEDDDIAFKPVISCFMDISYLVSALGNEMMSDIYELLELKGYHNVRSLMVPHPVKRRNLYDDDIIPFPEMDKIPLGMKKTLAKSDQIHTLEKLIYEDNPTVIKNLLNNPKITEKEVLKIVTRRPIKKSILMEVINMKRWVDRYIIKKAIIRNPYTPTDIALNFLHFMMAQDLSVIANDAGLHYSVREAARKLKKKKREAEPKV